MMNITLYTRSTPVCSACVRAKNLLDSKGIAYKNHDISQPGFDVEHLRTTIAPGAKTIPIVFVDGKWIGGADQLENLING